MIEYRTDVVVVGAFNPVIIDPVWLVEQGIVPEPEAMPDVILGFVPGASTKEFSLGGFDWKVGGSRLVLESTTGGDPSELITQILDRLSHTPVSAVGINLHGRIGEQDWKSERPRLPEPLQVVFAEVGHTVERSHTVKLACEGGVLLTVKIADSGPIIAVDLNYHHNARGIGAAVEILKGYAKRVDQGKAFVERLAGRPAQ